MKDESIDKPPSIPMEASADTIDPFAEAKALRTALTEAATRAG